MIFKTCKNFEAVMVRRHVQCLPKSQSVYGNECDVISSNLTVGHKIRRADKVTV